MTFKNDRNNDSKRKDEKNQMMVCRKGGFFPVIDLTDVAPVGGIFDRLADSHGVTAGHGG